jgi:translocation and assembly module TamA
MVILRAGLRALQTFADNHQIVLSADVGKILTSNFNQVPYNLRFFAGGDQSIRGYDYKSLSPLVNGYEVGGQNLIVGSLEYNYLFEPKLRGAVFVDAGNAYDNHFTTPTKIGAGFGIRYASPVGPIRVDLAAGVSESSPPIRLVFYIGAPL